MNCMWIIIRIISLSASLKNDETSFDPESAIEELSATAMLTFREGNEYATQETDADGNPVYKTPTGTTADLVILEGSDVTSAEAQMYQDPTTGTTQYEVTLAVERRRCSEICRCNRAFAGTDYFYLDG